MRGRLFDRAAMNGHFRHAPPLFSADHPDTENSFPQPSRGEAPRRPSPAQDQLLISEVQVFSICFTTDSGIGM